MTTQVLGTSVRAETVTSASVEHAFRVFTERMDTWWPKGHHIGGEVDHMVVEPRVGGGIIDHFADGRQCRWARILAFEPPHRLVFSWDITSGFEIERDHAKSSEVEVTFTAEGPQRTRVVLEHRNLDRHGDGWQSHRDAVGSDDGWQVGLDAFARAAEAA